MANRTSIKFDTPNTNIEVEVTGVLEWLRAIIGETEYTDLSAEVYGVRPSCITELLREKKPRERRRSFFRQYNILTQRDLHARRKEVEGNLHRSEYETDKQRDAALTILLRLADVGIHSGPSQYFLSLFYRQKGDELQYKIYRNRARIAGNVSAMYNTWCDDDLSETVRMSCLLEAASYGYPAALDDLAKCVEEENVACPRSWLQDGVPIPSAALAQVLRSCASKIRQQSASRNAPLPLPCVTKS